MEPEFPPNSNVSKNKPEEKNITRVTSGEAIRKKKPLRKKFTEFFIAGDAKTAIRYAVLDIALPAARDMAWETVSEGFRSLIFGEASRRRGYPKPPSGPLGVVNYQGYSMGNRLPSSQRAISRQARSRHDFDEILLESRTEAEQVIDQLFDVVSRYDTATVADLYELVGLASTHQDHKWGWTDLRGAGVSRSRDGYLLDLPDPVPIG